MSRDARLSINAVTQDEHDTNMELLFCVSSFLNTIANS